MNSRTRAAKVESSDVIAVFVSTTSGWFSATARMERLAHFELRTSRVFGHKKTQKAQEFTTLVPVGGKIFGAVSPFSVC
jgi:hypothetical protein